MVPALWATLFPVEAQTNKDSPLQFHGFLLGEATLRTTGQRPAGGIGGDFVLGETRMRINVTGATNSGAGFFQFKGDLFYDAVTNRFDVDIREGYAGYSAGPLDLRVGRQIITWGVGDLFFINDVFPKDWESFFSGRPMEYLKLGVDGVRLQYSPSAVSVDVVVVPFFTPDTFPSPRRFFVYDPFPRTLRSRKREPASTAGNTEVAVRVSRQVAGFDLSLQAYRGFLRSPSAHLDDSEAPGLVTRFYPRLQVYGAYAQRSLGAGVLSLEAGYYDSREDPRGDNPEIPNSQWRTLAGYQYQPWKGSTLGVQFYSETMEDYGAYRSALPPGAPVQNRFWGVVSLRFTQFLRYQSWRLSVFAARSPTAKEYFLQPEIQRRINDRLSVTLGANVFGGKSETTFFGQFQKDDNVYLGLRFDF